MDPKQMVIKFIIDLVIQYPITTSILTIIGTMRLIFKTIRIAAEMYVSETVTTKDDEKLEEIKRSKAYILIVKFFDLFTSIPLPGSKSK